MAIGMIGATVMPHNLYLHSSLVQSRAVSDTVTAKREACRFNLIDSVVALNAAFFVNAAILVMAAADFHSRGILVTEIQQAHTLLDGVLGSKLAPLAFAVALLAAGQSSTITGTLSGQIVMEGFLNLRMQPWMRRLVTRGLALVPATIVIALSGDNGLYRLLLFSQVVLSLQLPFAMIPLIHFTSDPGKMGVFANRVWVTVAASVIAAVVLALNLKLVFDALTGWLAACPFWICSVVLIPIGIVMWVLVGITIPLFFRAGRQWESDITTDAGDVANSIRPVRIRHIGVCLQHADGDGAILSAAIAEARGHLARITLLHVVDTPGTLMLGEESRSLHSSEDESYLMHLAREIEDADLSVEFSLRYGRPAEQIVEAVNAAGIDMLIMGSHGHRGMDDIVFGQTVSTVRHAIDIPVMVVRSHGQEKAQRSHSPMLK